MTEQEKQKCLNCANCDIDGSCIVKREVLFGSFICEHNEQFEPLTSGEINDPDKLTDDVMNDWKEMECRK